MTVSAVPTTVADKKSDEAEATEEITTTVSDPILQYSVLKVSAALEQLAKNAGPGYQKGSTEAEDVKRIQQALLKMDFNLGLAKDDSDFGLKTETAVKLFQENYQATNNTHAAYSLDNQNGVVDQYTLLGLDEALMEGGKYIDDEMDERLLTVPKGSLTFDSEGDDTEGSAYFTRIAHVPNRNGEVIGNSGITMGRGLDIGSRTASEVASIFDSAAQYARPISDALLTWLKQGAGKKKQTAYEHWKTLDAQVPADDQTITRKMQHYLFQEIYAEYVEKTKNLTTKADVSKIYFGEGKQVDWDALPENVKGVLIDLTYRGDYTGSEDKRGNTRKLIVPAVYQDQQEGLSGKKSKFYKIMKNENLWKNTFDLDINRFTSRWESL
jgi:peptidoglycan hydrolase-like protein with peptidoglycan-binding domain